MMKVATELKWVLILLELPLGFIALTLGYALMKGWLLLDTTVLAELPFHSYNIPGLILMVAVGVPLILAALSLCSKTTVGDFLSEYAGSFLGLTMLLGLLVIGYLSSVQYVFIFLSIVIVVLAAELHEFHIKRR